MSKLISAALLGLAAQAMAGSSSLDVGSGSTTDLGSGALSAPCTNVTIQDQGTAYISGAQVDTTGDVTINSGGTLDGGSGSLTVGGNWTNNGTFNASTGTVTLNGSCSSGAVQITGNTVFNNLIIDTDSGNTFQFPPGHQILVNGNLEFIGSCAGGAVFNSASTDKAYISLGPNATVGTYCVSLNNVQIGPDIIIPIPVPGVTPIPSLGTWSILLLSLLVALTMLRRQIGLQRKSSSSSSNHL